MITLIADNKDDKGISEKITKRYAGILILAQIAAIMHIQTG